MSYSSMISAAGVPVGAAGSLFQLPAATNFGDLSAAGSSFSVFGTAINTADSGFDPLALTTSITKASTDMTTYLTAKVTKVTTELPICTAAVASMQDAQALDALVARVSNFPDQIAKLPGPTCTIPSVSDGFKTITNTSSTISTSVNSMGAALQSNFAALGPVIASIQSAGGPLITSGQQLLSYVGTASIAVKSAVSDAISGSSSVVTALKSTFATATTNISTMVNTFATDVSTETAAVAKSLAHLTNVNVVKMLNVTNPCISSVLSNVIVPSQVDHIALGFAEVAKTVTLPGTESVRQAVSNKTVDAFPVTPIQPSATAIVARSPLLVPYTGDLIDTLLTPVMSQAAISNAIVKSNAEWLKTNVEDWKVSVRYEALGAAAGATPETPYGTTGTPADIAAWTPIYNNYLTLRNTFNTTLVVQSQVARKLYDDMNTEKFSRLLYGKYPYTYSASVGRPVPVERQFTYLDSTT